MQPTGICAANVKSMVSCIYVVELLQNCDDVNSGVTPTLLDNALDKHMVDHEAAYGDDLKIPKTHNRHMHYAQLLRYFKFFIPTFSHERKHKGVKQFANSRHNDAGQSRGILEDCTLVQFRDLEEPLERSYLRNSIPATKKIIEELIREGHASNISTILTSLPIVTYRRAVWKNDVALVSNPGAGNHSVGKVIFCCSIDALSWVCITMWDVVTVGRHEYKCRVKTTPHELIPAWTVLETCIYSIAGDGCISTVLIPPRLR